MTDVLGDIMLASFFHSFCLHASNNATDRIEARSKKSSSFRALFHYSCIHNISLLDISRTMVYIPGFCTDQLHYDVFSGGGKIDLQEGTVPTQNETLMRTSPVSENF